MLSSTTIKLLGGITIANTTEFNIGSIRAVVISDGYADQPLDPGEMFPDVTSGEFKKAVEEYNIDTESIRMDRNLLFLEIPGHRILIDAGVGHAWDGELLEGLTSIGLAPDEIDHIIYTHCHGDHIAGAVGKDKKLIFPNAQNYMWKSEWEFWSDPERYGEHKEYPANHPTLKATSLMKEKITLIEEEGEIFPGILAVQAPGHTMGHMAVMIHSEMDKLLVMGDAFLFPFQFDYIDWCAPFDRYPEIVIKSRLKLLEMASEDDVELLAYHFPFPGLGYAKRNGGIWEWEGSD